MGGWGGVVSGRTISSDFFYERLEVVQSMTDVAFNSCL